MCTASRDLRETEPTYPRSSIHHIYPQLGQRRCQFYPIHPCCWTSPCAEHRPKGWALPALTCLCPAWPFLLLLLPWWTIASCCSLGPGPLDVLAIPDVLLGPCDVSLGLWRPPRPCDVRPCRRCPDVPDLLTALCVLYLYNCYHPINPLVSPSDRDPFACTLGGPYYHPRGGLIGGTQTNPSNWCSGLEPMPPTTATTRIHHATKTTKKSHATKNHSELRYHLLPAKLQCIQGWCEVSCILQVNSFSAPSQVLRSARFLCSVPSLSCDQVENILC